MEEYSGFALVELLVVAAIVGLISTVVIIMINPTAMLLGSQEARARRDVVGVSEAMVSCIARNEADEGACDTWTKLYNGGFVGLAVQPVGVTIARGCVSEQEAGNQYCKYLTGTESVSCNQNDPC